MTVTAAFFIGDMVQIHEQISPGELVTRVVTPDDADYADAVALAVAHGAVPDPGLTQPPLTLAQAQARALVQIDARRGEERRLYLKDVFGQESVYREQRDEARILLADPDADPSADYPILAAEAAAGGIDPYHLAQVWLNKAHLWKQACADIEASVVAAKLAVERAEAPQDALDAANAFGRRLETTRSNRTLTD